jgi:cytochrome c-type biogenesis protein CcmH
VDRDLARGVLTGPEAETIRVEVSRRLLDADRRAAQAADTGNAPGTATGAVAVMIALAVVGGGLALYMRVGAPGYPDLPLAVRVEMAEAARASRPDQATAEAEAARARPRVEAGEDYLRLMEQLRATVAERPDDLQGQRLLARNEASLGNFAAARAAQERVLDLMGETARAEDWSDYADILVLAADGYVSPEAEAALGEALRRDPSNGPALYYSGLAMIQTGRPDLGFRIWDRLLAQSRPTDPWVMPVRARIRELAQVAGVRNYTPPRGVVAAAPGPTAEQLEAAAEMSPEERTEMIRGMVGGLSDRLATEGGPAEDWARLIAALGVLGEAEQARAIAEEAEQVFAGDQLALSMIAEARARAGLE